MDCAESVGVVSNPCLAIVRGEIPHHKRSISETDVAYSVKKICAKLLLLHRDECRLYAHVLAGLFDHGAGGWCRYWFLVEGRIFLDGPGKDDAIGHSLKGQEDFGVRSPRVFHGVDALLGCARVVDDGVYDL